MRYEELRQYTEEIKKCPVYDLESPPCKRIAIFRPVVNTLRPSQQYLIISSDPSSVTNKELPEDQVHSDFSARLMSLIFSGSDSTEDCEKILTHQKDFKEVFSKYFYWTHYSKCYAAGSPNRYCANNYLSREIDLFEPKLIISLGSKPVDHLLGSGNLKERVGKILDYNKIPVIASLHPSKNWNLGKRPEFKFSETWNLVRETVLYEPEDRRRIQELLEEPKN